MRRSPVRARCRPAPWCDVRQGSPASPVSPSHSVAAVLLLSVASWLNPFVQRSPVAAPDAGSHAFTALQADGTTPVGYDPCRPIRVAVNPSGAPPGWRELVETAIAHVSGPSGLRFVLVGVTDDRPGGIWDPKTGYAPVLVSWASTLGVRRPRRRHRRHRLQHRHPGGWPVLLRHRRGDARPRPVPAADHPTRRRPGVAADPRPRVRPPGRARPRRRRRRADEPRQRRPYDVGAGAISPGSPPWASCPAADPVRADRSFGGRHVGSCGTMERCRLGVPASRGVARGAAAR